MTHQVAAPEEPRDAEEGDFVAVSNGKSKSSAQVHSYRGSKTKGKGRLRAAAEEKSLSDLLQAKVDILEESRWLKHTLAQLTDNMVHKSRTRCTRCLCFGLGPLRHSPKSLLQLAFLRILLRRDILEIRKMVFVDPDFTPEDVAFLQALEFEVEDYKDDLLKLSAATFLYMPHCPRWLYENLLAVNEEGLQHMLLLSNDLSLYVDRELRSENRASIPHLIEFGRNKRFQVYTLAELEERPDAFNDMAWQWLQCHGQERSEVTGEPDLVHALGQLSTTDS